MAANLQGKVALVTGGSSGIGRSTALVFAREGARVVVADVVDEGGRETVQLVESQGGEAIFISANVTDPADVQGMIRKIVEAYGRLDCAHNNAGVWGATVPTAEYPESDWDRIIDINLKGVWLCMKYEIPQMLKQGGGVIVNTSSGAGLQGSPHACAYVASKHGVVGLTKTAAIEYARQGIRVNAVCPGDILTPMNALVVAGLGADPKEYAKKEPIGRLGTPEEVAETVAWLCTDAASFVTGHAMTVDGGEAAH